MCGLRTGDIGDHIPRMRIPEAIQKRHRVWFPRRPYMVTPRTDTHIRGRCLFDRLPTSRHAHAVLRLRYTIALQAFATVDQHSCLWFKGAVVGLRRQPSASRRTPSPATALDRASCRQLVHGDAAEPDAADQAACEVIFFSAEGMPPRSSFELRLSSQGPRAGPLLLRHASSDFARAADCQSAASGCARSNHQRRQRRDVRKDVVCRFRLHSPGCNVVSVGCRECSAGCINISRSDPLP